MQETPANPEILPLLARLGADRAEGMAPSWEELGDSLSSLHPRPESRALWAAALADPYLPWTRLAQCLVEGIRGNPHHLRPRDVEGERLRRDVEAYLALFLRIRASVVGYVDWPAGGLPWPELEGDGGWCDLCGLCCGHSGTVPTPEEGTDYPKWWYKALAGETLYPQPFCPFLYQARGRPLFFCAIHPLKPRACRIFDRADCERGKPGRGLPPSRLP